MSYKIIRKEVELTNKKKRSTTIRKLPYSFIKRVRNVNMIREDNKILYLKNIKKKIKERQQENIVAKKMLNYVLNLPPITHK